MLIVWLSTRYFQESAMWPESRFPGSPLMQVSDRLGADGQASSSTTVREPGEFASAWPGMTVTRSWQPFLICCSSSVVEPPRSSGQSSVHQLPALLGLGHWDGDLVPLPG